MAAGHDTSANILSWTVYIMATRQELQDRLREEMLRELGHETDLAYSQIEALPFLDSFLRETLRVYASGQYFALPRGKPTGRERLILTLFCSYDDAPANRKRRDDLWHIHPEGYDLRHRAARDTDEPADLGRGRGRVQARPVGESQ